MRFQGIERYQQDTRRERLDADAFASASLALDHFPIQHPAGEMLENWGGYYDTPPGVMCDV